MPYRRENLACCVNLFQPLLNPCASDSHASSLPAVSSRPRGRFSLTIYLQMKTMNREESNVRE